MKKKNREEVQVGFFNKFAGKDYEDKRPRDRYVAEAQRLLGVLDKRLEGREWLMGGRYSIADSTENSSSQITNRRVD